MGGLILLHVGPIWNIRLLLYLTALFCDNMLSHFDNRAHARRFVCLFLKIILCVCTITDFFAKDKARGVKFCTVVH